MLQKVVVIGPESTGKSTLCTQLATHYNTLWCPEFARDYLLKNGTNYTFDDLVTIAQGQLALEEDYTRQSENKQLPLLLIDTDMYVMKVWCEFVFEQCHTFILNEIVNRPYQLYLLCNTDLPWTKDELREYPNERPRQELFRIYKDILINQPVQWVEISGQNEARFSQAVAAINKYIFSEK